MRILQIVVDLPAELGEFRVEPDLLRALGTEGDRIVPDDATWSGRHHEHTGAQEHRLRDRMRDEQRGELLRVEQVDQLVVESLPGDFIERTERFVEQEDLGVQHQRASERAPHLHATGQLLGILVLVTDQVDQLDRLGRLGSALGLGHVLQLGVELDVALHRSPRQQRGILEHVAERIPVDVTDTGGVLRQTRRDAQQGRLAATGRSDHGDELAGRHRERHVVDGMGSVGEHHRQVLESQPR